MLNIFHLFEEHNWYVYNSLLIIINEYEYCNYNENHTNTDNENDFVNAPFVFEREKAAYLVYIYKT